MHPARHTSCDATSARIIARSQQRYDDSGQDVVRLYRLLGWQPRKCENGLRKRQARSGLARAAETRDPAAPQTAPQSSLEIGAEPIEPKLCQPGRAGLARCLTMRFVSL